ncbi:hypothetical protein ACIP6X_28745 [Streptomyces coeruleorubidus]|uniref:hypothetical protein n=1 Tax=Streptomyces coeruleorubidus TaxID=116188 RepID=UPI00381DFC84
MHVMTPGAAARRLALELGAASARDAYARPPEPLDSAILFAPVGELVPVALRALDRGGPPHGHTSAALRDRALPREAGAQCRLQYARGWPRVPDPALTDLKAGRFDGAAVLVNDLS